MNTSKTAGHFTDDQFSVDATGLPRAEETRIVDLDPGTSYKLVAAPVRKRIGDSEVRLLAYNGSVPGPALRVRQGSTVAIRFTNQTDLESTVHWHGLRLENRFDGTHETQAPVPVGGSFTYQVQFPDPGVYWYHPHIREDYGQELGLYGNVLVVPNDPGYWPPVHRELALTLDDILLEDGAVAPFSRSQTTFTAMGRFGNTFLVNGEPDRVLSARTGEVVRFYLTNTANTRVFNVGFTGARMKLVGGDSGRCEREEFVETVLLAPSERAVVDVLFDRPGAIRLEHHTPNRTYGIATVTVAEDQALPPLAEEFAVLRSDPGLAAERAHLAAYLDAEPDKTLAFVAEMNLGAPEAAGDAVVYSCPMHPEVTSQESGRCPKCGMTLLPTAMVTSYTCPMHPEIVRDEPGNCPICGMKLVPSQLVAQGEGHSGHHQSDHHSTEQHPQHHDQHAEHQMETSAHHGHHEEDAHAHHVEDAHHHHAHEPEHADHGAGRMDGIEWEDDMVAINRMTTPANMRWKLVDRETGAENHAIDWHFRVGDRIKIRLINEMDSDHPMHHPFHVHGAGRFLVLSRDGVVEPNLIWKDTVLVRTGQTVDILLDVTNPGVWMAHCHIAEHHEGGMMMSFHVTE